MPLEQGLTTEASTPAERPKQVSINTVENGFTAHLQGGKRELGLFTNYRPFIANNTKEVIKLVSEFLAE